MCREWGCGFEGSRGPVVQGGGLGSDSRAGV